MADSENILIVYHRPRLFNPKSPNGIIPTLSNIENSDWLSWTLDIEDSENVILELSDVERYYTNFCKVNLWPLFHNFIEQINRDWTELEHYKKVNKLFAEKAIMKKKCKIWIHDYNLLLMPKYLRELDYRGKIYFFFHTSFPDINAFSILPNSQEIIESLMCCDNLGFHIPRYANIFFNVVNYYCRVENFKEEAVDNKIYRGCKSVLYDLKYYTQFTYDGRIIKLTTYPIPLNNSPKCDTSLKKSNNICSLICFSRIDYIKDPLGVLGIYNRILIEKPELIGKVVFHFGCTRSKVKGYSELQDRVDHFVHEINTRFSFGDYLPIIYYENGLSNAELVKLYESMDCCIIGSLSDGLNMVAKEYIDNNRVEGQLLLSHFAGVSVEIDGPILFNPYNNNEVKQKLINIITNKNDNSSNFSYMKKQISMTNIKDWVETHTSD